MTEVKYAEIRDLIKRTIFRAVLRTELPDSANLMTERYVLVIKPNEDNKNDIKRDTFPENILIS